jgi:hypothetical protein
MVTMNQPANTGQRWRALQLATRTVQGWDRRLVELGAAALAGVVAGVSAVWSEGMGVEVPVSRGYAADVWPSVPAKGLTALETTLVPQYLINVLDDTSNSATGAEGAAIDVFNDGLQANGHWVFAGGLTSPSLATVIDARVGEAVFTEGPFVESRVYVAGFWIIKASSLDEALRLAAAGSKACNRRVEVRAFNG